MSYDPKLRESLEKKAQEIADYLKCEVKLYRMGDRYKLVPPGEKPNDGNVVFTASHTYRQTET